MANPVGSSDTIDNKTDNKTDNKDVRWSIKVSTETDRNLRTYLAQKGMKKGDLSRFVEEAVQERLYHLTIDDIQARNVAVPAEELETIVEEAVRWVRQKQPA